MTPLFIAFIDGLKPESIKYMPFLNSLETKRRIRTELGFSPTCYASMFTGVYPNKHLHWFTWKYSPGTSPYMWIRRFKLDKLPNIVFTNYVYYKISDRLAHGLVPWQGVMSLPWWYIPVSSWPYLDIAVKKHWTESNFVEDYPSVFDILRAKRISYEIVGLDETKPMEQYSFNETNPLTFFFIGDIDPLSHHYGQDSSLVIERLKEIDAMLQEKYSLLESKVGDFQFIVFSDHGHVRIDDSINMKSVFSSNGESLNDYIYLMDANFARFWFRDEGEKQRVQQVLSQFGNKGFILTEEHFQKYHVDMPDNRYGDLIFYLDVPFMFTMTPPIVTRIRRSGHVSLHGYMPDYPDCDGVFVSNREAQDSSHIELIDILPSILDIFGIEIPAYVDGKIVWE